MWDASAEDAFQSLKEAMVPVPVFALPDFSKSFVVKIDASKEGMGAMLMQEGHPIAYISKAFSARNKNLSTYEREIFAIKQ